MTIRTSTLKPNTTTPRAAATPPAPEAPGPETAPEEAKPRLPAPGPRHAKVAKEPALRAATQTAIEVVLDGGDTYRMLGLVSAMALEQKVSTAHVLQAMKDVVDAWGHLADDIVRDLP